MKVCLILHSQLGDSELNTTIDTSLSQPDSQVSSSETFSGDDLPTSSQATRRAPLNDFFPSFKADTVGPYLKRWEEAGERTRASHVLKTYTIIVAGLNVIAPGDIGYLWEAVRKSGSVEKKLGIGEQQEDRKWGTGRVLPKRIWLGNKASDIINHGRVK